MLYSFKNGRRNGYKKVTLLTLCRTHSGKSEKKSSFNDTLHEKYCTYLSDEKILCQNVMENVFKTLMCSFFFQAKNTVNFLGRAVYDNYLGLQGAVCYTFAKFC